MSISAWLSFFCVVCFPWSICLWITWVAGRRMYETRDYVYAPLVVKKKRDWSACLVSLMKISSEVTSLRQTMWCYDNGHTSVPILWGAASSPKHDWKKNIFAAYASQCIDAFWFLSSKEDVFHYQASKPWWAHRSLLLEHVAEVLHSLWIGSRAIYYANRTAVHAQ